MPQVNFFQTNWCKIADGYESIISQMYKDAGGKNQIEWYEPQGETETLKNLVNDLKFTKKLMKQMQYVDFVEYEEAQIRYYDGLMEFGKGIAEWKRGIEIYGETYNGVVCGYTTKKGKKALGIAFYKYSM